MKKIFTLLLAALLLASLPVTAFAAGATLDEGKKSETLDVVAMYTDGGTVYSVDISWDSMEFTYTSGGTKVWNPETHAYDIIGAGGSWSNATPGITVTNHSNASVSASFAFSALTAYDELTGSFTANSLTLPSAEGKALNDASLTGTTTFTLGGTLPSDTTSYTKVGTITVTIA